MWNRLLWCLQCTVLVLAACDRGGDAPPDGPPVVEPAEKPTPEPPPEPKPTAPTPEELNAYAKLSPVGTGPCGVDDTCDKGSSCVHGACVPASFYTRNDTDDPFPPPPPGTPYRDLVDGGDKPRVPGCHYAYLSHDCEGIGIFFAGDRCPEEKGPKLVEWTNPACHPTDPLDRTPHDCNDVCRPPHVPNAVRGQCETQPKICPDLAMGTRPSGAPSRPSAMCVCYDKNGEAIPPDV